MRKAISHPHSENPVFFVLVCLGAAVALLTIDTWTFASAAFPIYIFIFPAVLAATIWRRQAASSSLAA